jgi:hypothetical protein
MALADRMVVREQITNDADRCGFDQRIFQSVNVFGRLGQNNRVKLPECVQPIAEVPGSTPAC